jgi:hypothetical protein
VIAGALILALGVLAAVLLLRPSDTPECPLDMVWDKERGECVSAWVEPTGGLEPMSQWIEVQFTGLPEGAQATVSVALAPDDRPQEYQITGSTRLNLTELGPGSYYLDFSVAVDGQDRYYPLGHTPGKSIEVTLPGENVVPVEYAPLLLTFSGLGNLRLGMTLDEAKSADLSVQAEQDSDKFGSECYIGSNAYADIGFNPDQKLAYIAPKAYVATEAGIRAGAKGVQVQQAYRLTNAGYLPEGFAGVYVKPDGTEQTDGTLPAIGINFGDSGAPASDLGELEIASATVQSIYLEGGQQCFD